MVDKPHPQKTWAVTGIYRKIIQKNSHFTTSIFHHGFLEEPTIYQELALCDAMKLAYSPPHSFSMAPSASLIITHSTSGITGLNTHNTVSMMIMNEMQMKLRFSYFTPPLCSNLPICTLAMFHSSWFCIGFNSLSNRACKVVKLFPSLFCCVQLWRFTVVVSLEYP